MEAEKTDYPPRGFDSFIWLWFPVLALLLAALGNPAFRVYAAEIKVTVDFPTDGSTFAKPAPRAIIAGRAQVSGILAPLLDLAIVIDRSGSTASPSGADINGNGIVGEMRRFHYPFKLQDLLQPRITDPGDTVLAAELAGAVNLLKFLDTDNTWVSVVSFGKDLIPQGGRVDQLPDARVERPLLSNYHGPDKFFPTNKAKTLVFQAFPRMLNVINYEEIRQALNIIGARESQGGTNISAAIREATADLIRTNADIPARPGAKKVMLLLTDGFPSSPVGSPNVDDPEDTILALRAAYQARKAGIEIHTYALGPKAVSTPFALTEIARITGGRFNPISDPSQILYRLKEFIFAQLKSLVVENATLNQPAEQVALGPEGAYIAVVPVKEGVNKIAVTGTANDGTQRGASVLLNYLLEGERDAMLQPTKRELVLGPDIKSYDELKLELEKESNRWLELNRKTKELELKAREKELKLKTEEKEKGQEQLELDLEVK